MQDKIFSHLPINTLFATVKNDLRKLDNEGLIDDGTLIKTVMHCNEKLGLTIREVREIALAVQEHRAEKPLDFDRLYYACALGPTNTLISELRNPFDNNFDQDIVYEASLDRNSLGNPDSYNVTIERKGTQVVHNYGSWVKLDVSKSSEKYCHLECPLKRRKGAYTIDINEDYIETPFRAGTLYLVYLGLMKDEDGNITYPFHPLITPYYEWSLKVKILQDALFNSDTGFNETSALLQTAEREKTKCWLDAFNFTVSSDYGRYVDAQRKKELGWYNQWFRLYQNF
jgi:hypothetical protein